MDKRLARIHELLRSIHHVTVATTCADGRPLATPVFASFDDDLTCYWSSHPANLHSRNIDRSGQTFIVLYDSKEGHGGLFIEAMAKEITEYEALRRAYRSLAAAKQHLYGPMNALEHYQRPDGPRLYEATPAHLWTNDSERDDKGSIIRDRRIEIQLSQLQKPTKDRDDRAGNRGA